MIRRALTKIALLVPVALGLAAGFVRPAEAAFVLTFAEVESDVVGTGSGSLDTTALTFNATYDYDPVVFPFYGTVRTGGRVNVYEAGVSGPAAYGLYVYSVPTDSSGDAIFLQGIGGGFVGTPIGYTPGDPLATSMTFDGQTLASLGMTQGTYVWTWGSGPTADSFTINIGVNVVPEPGTLALLGLSLAGLAITSRRK